METGPRLWRGCLRSSGACRLTTSDKRDDGSFGCSGAVLGSGRCDVEEAAAS